MRSQVTELESHGISTVPVIPAELKVNLTTLFDTFERVGGALTNTIANEYLESKSRIVDADGTPPFLLVYL